MKYTQIGLSKSKLPVANVITVLLLLWIPQCKYFQTLQDPKELKELTPEQKVYPSPITENTTLLEDREKIEAERKAKFGKYIYYVNKVYVKNRMIWDSTEAKTGIGKKTEGYIADFVNFFHWTTEADIIEQELLFYDDNDKLTDYDLLTETERNLRSTALFKTASVFYFDADQERIAEINANPSEEFKAAQELAKKEGKEVKVVNLGVETRDRNTSTVAFQPSGSGGNFSLGMSAGERNLFGRRYLFNGSYSGTTGGTGENAATLQKFGQTFGKARIAGSYWTAQESTTHDYYKGEFVRHTGSAVVQRPFYSLRTPWAYEVGAARTEGDVIEFIAGEEAYFDVRQSDGTISRISSIQTIEGTSFYGQVERAYGVKEKFILGLTAGQRVERYTFRDREADPFAERELNHSEDNYYVQPSFKFQTHGYVKTRNFRKYILEEDVRLGWDTSVSVRQTLPGLGRPDRFTRISEQVSYAGAIQAPVFPFFYELAVFNTNEREHKKDVWENNITSAATSFFWGFNPLGHFANKGAYAFGSEIFNQDTFENAGLDLRGLGQGTLTGNRKLVLKAEFRTQPIKIWIMGLGFVFFTDWGDVWWEDDFRSDGRPFQLKGTVGFGIRLAELAIQNSLFRLDFGIPVVGAEVTTNTIVSFGLNQTF